MCRLSSLVCRAVAVLSLVLASCDSGHEVSPKSDKPARDKVCKLPDGSAAVPSKLALDELCGCVKIEGDLSIDASAVSDLQCLRSLRQVTGTLEISTPSGAASQLTSLKGLDRLERAHGIALTGLAQLESLQPLGSLREVQSMALTQLPALRSLEGLGAKLDHLELTRADGLTDLHGLRADIREFWLSKNAQLRTLDGFAGLAAAPSSVRVESHPELESLAGLFRSDQPRLDSVQLTGLPKLEAADFRGASELRVLVVRSCTALRELRGLESIESLEVLYLTGLSALQSVPKLSKLKRIVELELIELPVLSSLESLSSLTSLDRLALNYLDALPNLRGLQGVTTAQRILLEDVPGLRTLEGLDGLETVDQLWISNADRLTSLQGLELREARELAVRYNDELKSVDGLETLHKVSTIDVSENPVLTSLRGLSNLREADKVFAHLNGKLPQCELDRVMKQLPESTTREFGDNGPAGTCAP